MARLSADDIDLATLSWLAGSAANTYLLVALHQAGHPALRNAHGYVFQNLIGGPKTVGELAAALDITQQGASKVVGELIELGYLTRDSHADDRRVTRVALSATGHDAIAAARRHRAALEKSLSSRVGKDGIAAVKNALWALLEIVGAQDDVTLRRAKPPRN